MSDLWRKQLMPLVAGASFAVGTLVCALTSSWALLPVGRALEAVAVTAPTVAYGLFRDILPRRYVPASIDVTDHRARPDRSAPTVGENGPRPHRITPPPPPPTSRDR